ncbi:hypothetical protein [Candidatus Liberibacter americanus]|nr:hypothetical protein [Candidatus Liberibacter americanus]
MKEFLQNLWMGKESLGKTFWSVIAISVFAYVFSRMLCLAGYSGIPYAPYGCLCLPCLAIYAFRSYLTGILLYVAYKAYKKDNIWAFFILVAHTSLFAIMILSMIPTTIIVPLNWSTDFSYSHGSEVAVMYYNFITLFILYTSSSMLGVYRTANRYNKEHITN